MAAGGHGAGRLIRLQGPLGREREFASGGFNATLRDSGRLGQMMLDGGKANGRQLLPTAWVRESTKPTDPGGPYGYLWWAADRTGACRAVGI